MKPQLILVAGPYRSGTNDDPALIARNVEAMTEAAALLFRAGHLPVMGEWFALPLVQHALQNARHLLPCQDRPTRNAFRTRSSRFTPSWRPRDFDTPIAACSAAD